MNKREYAQANRTSSESRDELAQSMPSRKRERAKLNKEWLTSIAQEEEVKPLPKGIYYKVLAEGKVQPKVIREDKLNFPAVFYEGTFIA